MQLTPTCKKVTKTNGSINIFKNMLDLVVFNMALDLGTHSVVLIHKHFIWCHNLWNTIFYILNKHGDSNTLEFAFSIE